MISSEELKAMSNEVWHRSDEEDQKTFKKAVDLFIKGGLSEDEAFRLLYYVGFTANKQSIKQFKEDILERLNKEE